MLSAKSPEALRGQAVRLGGWLADRPGGSVADVACSLVSTRAVFAHRAVVVGSDREGLLGALAGVADGVEVPGVVIGQAVQGSAGVVMVFPGQGSQWVGMARELMDHSPVFAEWMRRCEQALAEWTDWSLLDVLDQEHMLARVDVVQPVLWAVMVSLAQVWRSVGVEPAAVVGHSQGEIAAVCVAGGLSLGDAARVVALRSRLIAEELAGGGGMVAVEATAEEVAERIARWRGRVSVAAVNGVRSTVVSGEDAALEEMIAACEVAGLRTRRVPVDYASHSASVETIRERLLAVLEGIRPRASAVPVYSTVEAAVMDTAVMDGEYWYRNLRETVRFAETTRVLLDAGFSVFVEASAHPVLTSGIEATAEDMGVRASALGT
ncbi:acyltransferase domain-containing protein, partial [Kitasatospora sp. NPDC086801]|uniref:acyltransferase domain-containing protein n=1 Tax=Kitasatospora sp. NPDC086801 TaxID=3364066 RepID=UPI0037F75570